MSKNNAKMTIYHIKNKLPVIGMLLLMLLLNLVIIVWIHSNLVDLNMKMNLLDFKTVFIQPTSKITNILNLKMINLNIIDKKIKISSAIILEKNKLIFIKNYNHQAILEKKMKLMISLVKYANILYWIL